MTQNLDQGCVLMDFIDLHNFFENGSKLPKIWSKNADFLHFRIDFWSRNFYGKFIAAHTDALNSLFFDRNVP